MEATTAAPIPSKPPSLRTNVFANFIGRISGMALGLLFTPLYIHFLGIESYGLIGFYLTLQGSMTFLEMGLSRACNRELARYSGEGEEAVSSMRNTLRSLEGVYWAVSLLIGTGITLLAPWIASSWLSASTLPPNVLESILIIMAWVIALRWPVGLYQGALMGLQRHVQMNLAQVALSLLSGGGAVLVLWQIEASIQAYFWWQLCAVLIGVLLFAFLAWWVMPGRSVRASFSIQRLRHVYRFAAGVGANAVLGTILRQADKLIVSALLPLKQFAYYALASLIVQTIAMVADAVSNAVFPRFSQMLGAKAPQAQLSRLYHFTSQGVAVLIVPFALSLAFFAEEALYVYTGDLDIAQNTAPILAILSIAKMLHASMIVPYALQLAHGWVRLSIYINIASVIWLVPALYLFVEWYGPTGAAFAWLAVTLLYVSVGTPLMHRKLMPGEGWSWMWHSVLLPVSVVGVALLAMDYLVPQSGQRWWLGAELIGVGLVAMALSIISTEAVRRQLMNEIKVRFS